VGTTSAACLAGLGHTVTGVDVSEDKVDLISRGKSPIQEPQVGEKLADAYELGRISATGDVSIALKDADLCFVCVGTPSLDDGSIDASYLKQVIEQIADERMKSGRYIPIFVRSTSLPAVHDDMISVISNRVKQSQPIGYCVHPEFLREGQAVSDFEKPPKIVFGYDDDEIEKYCDQLYPGIEAATAKTDPRTAALVKYADNCFHAVKVTFGNEIGKIARSFGADARKVMDIFCLDTKLNISPLYLRPGLPFGGSCLPKDLRGVNTWCRQNSIETPMLENVVRSNDLQVEEIVETIMKTACQNIGFVGLSFKENTDDVRESPMVRMVEQLVGRGREVKVFDEILAPSRLVGANLKFAVKKLPHLTQLLVDDCDSLVKQCDLIVIARKLDQYTLANLPWRKEQMVLDLADCSFGEGFAPVGRGLYWPLQ